MLKKLWNALFHRRNPSPSVPSDESTVRAMLNLGDAPGLALLRPFMPAIRSEPEEPPAMTKQQVNAALYHMKDNFHCMSRLAELLDAWREIPTVRCPVPFLGWGYVDGRTHGFIIHRSKGITLVEADSDMGFTDVCVLINGMPCLMLEVRHGHLTVEHINQDVEDLRMSFGHGYMQVDNAEQLSDLPMPLQRCMLFILGKFIEAAKVQNRALDRLSEAGRRA